MNDDSRIESLVRAAGQALRYPQTPRLNLHPTRKWPPRPNLPKLLVPVVLALLLALIAIPPVRAQLFEIFRLGGMEILVEPDGAPSPLRAVDLLSGRELLGRTTLEEAEDLVDFAISLPDELGTPDAVYVQNIGTGPFVVLVWAKPEDASSVGYVLYILAPGTVLSKGPLPAVIETQVQGEAAIWTNGPYLVDIQGSHQAARLVEGFALIWSRDGLTYRLEGAATLDEAIRIASTID